MDKEKAMSAKTDNERIAEWLGWVRLPEAMGGLEWAKPSGTPVSLPWFDMYTTKWCQPDGLFDEIKKRGLWGAFLTQLLKDMDVFVATEDDGSEWIETRHIYDLLTVGPSQLTVTLLVVIDAEAEKDDQR